MRLFSKAFTAGVYEATKKVATGSATLNFKISKVIESIAPVKFAEVAWLADCHKATDSQWRDRTGF